MGVLEVNGMGVMGEGDGVGLYRSGLKVKLVIV